MRTESGQTLLELLIALLISTIVGTLLIKESLIITKNTKKIELENKLGGIRNHLNAILNPINNGSWESLPRMELLNAETFITSFTHLRNSKLRPQGQVIANINYITDFYIIPIKETSNLYCLIRLSKNVIPAPSGLNYLALDKNRWQETRMKFKKKKHGRCLTAYELTESINYNSPFNNSVAKLEDSILIPINDSFSVYLDLNNSIRKLDHSSRNNQPIEYKIGNLEFEQNTELIRAKITLNGRQREFSIKKQSPKSSLELYAILLDQQQLNQGQLDHIQ